LCAIFGRGIDELRKFIDLGAAGIGARDATGPARLPVDRAFTVKGFGVVVTGTLVSGRLEVGQSAELLPSGERGKVRGLQIHGQSVPRAQAGTRLAVNLAGIESEAVERWQWLVKDGELGTTKELDARVELLSGCKRALGRRSRVSVHAGTATTLATLVLLDADELAPGGDALGRLKLDSPLVVMQGDRFILRGDTALAPYGGTIGGGSVLRPLAGRYRRRADAAERAAKMESATGPEKAAAEVLWAGPVGLSPDDLRRRIAPDPAAALAGAKKAGTVLEVEPGRLVHPETIASLVTTARELVAAHHEARPLEPGIGREELRTRLHGGTVSPRLFQRVLEDLAKKGVVAERDVVRLSTHKPREEGRGSELGEQLAKALGEGALQPPRVKELATIVGASDRDTVAGLKLLASAGRATRVSDELYFDAAALADLRTRLVAYLEQKGSISAQEWKDLTGASRKFTIPLAEHFDSEKLTMRVGETRVLRRKA
jgi:selenocysteine-specific elongation factor